MELTAQVGGSAQTGVEEEFVVVRLALNKVSDQFITVSQVLLSPIREDEDYQYLRPIGGIAEPTFNGGQFAPGEIQRGTFVFEVTEDSGRLDPPYDLDVSLFGGIDRVLTDLHSGLDRN